MPYWVRKEKDIYGCSPGSTGRVKNQQPSTLRIPEKLHFEPLLPSPTQRLYLQLRGINQKHLKVGCLAFRFYSADRIVGTPFSPVDSAGFWEFFESTVIEKAKLKAFVLPVSAWAVFEHRWCLLVIAQESKVLRLLWPEQSEKPVCPMDVKPNAISKDGKVPHGSAARQDHLVPGIFLHPSKPRSE